MWASPQARGSAHTRGELRKPTRIMFVGRANPTSLRANAGRACPLCHPY